MTGEYAVDDNYNNTKVNASYFMDLIKAVAVSLIVTLAILMISAMLLCFTDFPEQYTLPSAIAATIIGVFSGSTMAAKKNPNNKLAFSLLTAFSYSLLSYLVGCISQGKFIFTLNTALFLAISLLTAAVASVLANKQRSTKKYNTHPTSLADRFKKKTATKSYGFNKTGR